MRWLRRRAKAERLEAELQVLLQHGFLEARRRPDGTVAYVMTAAGRQLMAEDP